MDERAGEGPETTPEIQLLSREDLEDEVRERTAYLENLMDTMVDVLIKLDPDGRISMVNQACEEILGYPESEVVGKPIDYIFAEQGADDQLSSMLSQAEFVERLLTDRQLTDVEVTFETAAGERIPTSLSASVMDGEDGTIAGMVCVAKDISERKAAEEQAEFLQSLLRHDLGNKLQITQGSLEVALEGDVEDAEHLLESALAGTEEAIELIENVRMLERLDSSQQRHALTLGKVVDGVVDQYDELAAREEIEIETDVDPEIEVMAGTLLSELFGNLVENALVHSGGSLVRIQAESEDPVTVCVEDDGCGIPAEKRTRILQKGEKGAGSSGSGLGTYLASRIAETYGGELEVSESSLGGALFEVRLPPA